MYKAVTLAGGIREPLLTCSSDISYSVPASLLFMHVQLTLCISNKDISKYPLIIMNAVRTLFPFFFLYISNLHVPQTVDISK